MHVLSPAIKDTAQNQQHRICRVSVPDFLVPDFLPRKARISGVEDSYLEVACSSQVQTARYLCFISHLI